MRPPACPRTLFFGKLKFASCQNASPTFSFFFALICDLRCRCLRTSRQCAYRGRTSLAHRHVGRCGGLGALSSRSAGRVSRIATPSAPRFFVQSGFYGGCLPEGRNPDQHDWLPPARSLGRMLAGRGLSSGLRSVGAILRRPAAPGCACGPRDVWPFPWAITLARPECPGGPALREGWTGVGSRVDSYGADINAVRGNTHG